MSTPPQLYAWRETLLDEVVRDPEAEARILQQILELRDAFTARHQAPHRRRTRMQ